MFFIFFLCLLALRNGYGQEVIANLKEPKEYLKNVVNFIWERLQDYDLSNLPVANVEMSYNNVSSYGYNLNGDVYYNDGFVMDVSSVELEDRETKVFLCSSLAKISGLAYVKGLQIFQDFYTDFTVGEALGSVIVKTDRLSIAIEVMQDLSTFNVTSKVPECNYSNKLEWNYHPDNGITKRLRRYYLTSIRNQTGILQETCTSWLPVVQGFLEEALKAYEFPPLVF